MRLSVSTLLRLAPLLRLRPVLASSPRIITNINAVSPLSYTTATPHVAAMASDQAYLDFLNRASEDPAAGRAQAADATPSGADKPFKALDEGASVPKDIAEATRGDDLLYTSDADEPFEPVALQWQDDNGAGLPSESEFAKLIDHWDPSSAQIEIQDPADWDRRGQYRQLLEAVRNAVKGNDVRVYRVARSGARAEYWLVGREDGDEGKKRIVGAKALAVES